MNVEDIYNLESNAVRVVRRQCGCDQSSVMSRVTVINRLIADLRNDAKAATIIDVERPELRERDRPKHDLTIQSNDEVIAN